MFNYDTWLDNKQIIQITNKNIDSHTIYDLNVPSMKKHVFPMSKKFIPSSDIQIGPQLVESTNLWDKQLYEKFGKDFIFTPSVIADIKLSIKNVNIVTNVNEIDKLMLSSLALINIKEGHGIDIILLEYIMHTIPVIAPKTPLFIQYLGKDYPLLFNNVEDIPNLLTPENVKNAVAKIILRQQYFTVDHFIRSFENLTK